MAPEAYSSDDALPDASSLNNTSPPSTAVTKRTPDGSLDGSPDGDTSSNKRQKTVEQIAPKSTIKIEDVFLLLKGNFIKQVPLLNFTRLTPEKAKRLSYEVCENDNHRLEYCTYDASAMLTETVVRQFAGWITHGHLQFLTTNALEDGSIYSALYFHELVDEGDYRDELVDTWMSWLRDGRSPGSLNVDRLQCGGHMTLSGSVFNLMCALVLWHDVRAVLVPSSVIQQYNERICKEVSILAQTFFIIQLPKDPLGLSNKQFCDLYHVHD